MILEVGQRLWYVPTRNRLSADKDRYVTVTKVGRKYAYADGINSYAHGKDRIRLEDPLGRILVETPWYGIAGECYLDRATYEADKRAKQAWMRLFRHRPARPAHVTEEMIQQAAGLLGLNLKG